MLTNNASCMEGYKSVLGLHQQLQHSKSNLISNLLFLQSNAKIMIRGKGSVKEGKIHNVQLF